ncbi:hypothetical protein RTBOTA2_001442 [Rhodotorula toruloides]|nr:hypothetical protein RTBOTA2_001442 [Rhodotorula toruloides]
MTRRTPRKGGKAAAENAAKPVSEKTYRTQTQATTCGDGGLDARLVAAAAESSFVGVDEGIARPGRPGLARLPAKASDADFAMLAVVDRLSLSLKDPPSLDVEVFINDDVQPVRRRPRRSQLARGRALVLAQPSSVLFSLVLFLLILLVRDSRRDVLSLRLDLGILHILLQRLLDMLNLPTLALGFALHPPRLIILARLATPILSELLLCALRPGGSGANLTLVPPAEYAESLDELVRIEEEPARRHTHSQRAVTNFIAG